MEFRLWKPQTSSRKKTYKNLSRGTRGGGCPVTLIPSPGMHGRLKLLQLTKSHQPQWSTENSRDLSPITSSRTCRVLETSTPSHSSARLAPWLSSGTKHTLSNTINQQLYHPCPPPQAIKPSLVSVRWINTTLQHLPLSWTLLLLDYFTLIRKKICAAKKSAGKHLYLLWIAIVKQTPKLPFWQLKNFTVLLRGVIPWFGSAGSTGEKHQLISGTANLLHS